MRTYVSIKEKTRSLLIKVRGLLEQKTGQRHSFGRVIEKALKALEEKLEGGDNSVNN